ncbi:uncharacterized protein LOC120359505 [Solenopsis invicta]|uniref:uncharacterized protein LOC120359505 n=1 Tax=Solenopsis invicta TaxID=13686 RepID=UPI00193E48AF|nr:uncharacterized protein LOC120359505 [Solenopsis invicta]
MSTYWKYTCMYRCMCAYVGTSFNTAVLGRKQDENSKINIVQLLCEIDLDVKAATDVLNGQDNKLKDSARNKLRSAIIKYELKEDENKKITQKRFQEIALQIQNAIPGEVEEVYYISYKRILENKKVNAKGNLYDKYINYVKHLRKNGWQKRKIKSTDFESDVILNDDLMGKLEWLRNHKEPYEE